MSDNARVEGFCPMGCGETLTFGNGGYITCGSIDCPRPDAVSELLEDREHEHIVELGERNFAVRHPLRERLDDALTTCDLHNWITEQSGPPFKPGRYRVAAAVALPGDWLWTAAPFGRSADGPHPGDQTGDTQP